MFIFTWSKLCISSSRLFSIQWHLWSGIDGFFRTIKWCKSLYGIGVFRFNTIYTTNIICFYRNATRIHIQRSKFLFYFIIPWSKKIIEMKFISVKRSSFSVYLNIIFSYLYCIWQSFRHKTSMSSCEVVLVVITHKSIVFQPEIQIGYASVRCLCNFFAIFVICVAWNFERRSFNLYCRICFSVVIYATLIYQSNFYNSHACIINLYITRTINSYGRWEAVIGKLILYYLIFPYIFWCRSSTFNCRFNFKSRVFVIRFV